MSRKTLMPFMAFAISIQIIGCGFSLDKGNLTTEDAGAGGSVMQPITPTGEEPPTSTVQAVQEEVSENEVENKAYETKETKETNDDEMKESAIRASGTETTSFQEYDEETSVTSTGVFGHVMMNINSVVMTIESYTVDVDNEQIVIYVNIKNGLKNSVFVTLDDSELFKATGKQMNGVAALYTSVDAGKEEAAAITIKPYSGNARDISKVVFSAYVYTSATEWQKSSTITLSGLGSTLSVASSSKSTASSKAEQSITASGATESKRDAEEPSSLTEENSARFGSESTGYISIPNVFYKVREGYENESGDLIELLSYDKVIQSTYDITIREYEQKGLKYEIKTDTESEKRILSEDIYNYGGVTYTCFRVNGNSSSVIRLSGNDNATFHKLAKDVMDSWNRTK